MIRPASTFVACYASPAIAHGQIFIRALHDLYCIGKLDRGQP